MQNSFISGGMIPSVNFHLWEPCNMRCGFCFARFQDVRSTILPKGHLPREQALEVVRELAAYGFRKITFAGGEPTLCPWLHELVAEAKSRGMLTMIVSNGSRLTEDYLRCFDGNLDWMVLSVDSLDPVANTRSGRMVPGSTAFDRENYTRLCRLIRKVGLQLKINTVVHAGNWSENLKDFILEIRPDRWKILQVLRVDGQNDADFARFQIAGQQFADFCERNRTDANGIPFVPENTEVIQGSYVMVDPAGRFFDDTKGFHTYSGPILALGVTQALGEINFDADKFWGRDGGYYLQ
ncbi:MAG: viperin family antiviral radical SAM protein [Bacteroidia bacterium]|nr:viperin family antiviral radical SAM protein [Bacteroidia bacterium]